ncbi:flagellar filament capping protein FliD [uncultured Paraglaciecola sp.]|uniref:flagellar filament capping protein FliD n=1 Tax=uncultured Paraglaciecola sp. TaxID=1765024 RepID=UPI002591EC0F|nr:flagellar filament capping protein FliD [uncultured Paraglaciecola sp.]
MSIQSLGVGSGLDLEGLVTQLLQAESEPKTAALDAREESVEAEISAIGQLKSKLEDFQDSLDDLRSETNLKGREPTINNPSSDIEPFTAEASNSALEGDYQITVTQLASGSRIETADAADGGFSSTSDSVLSTGTGSLTFKIDATSDAFTIDLSAGDSLEDLRNAINNSDDNFGVTASIITTGTADGGSKLVFTSDVTGDGNDLVIVNDNDIAELDRVSTTNSLETIDYLSPVSSAQNSKATIDGIDVESESDEFENVIENVSFTVSELSELAADGVTYQASKLSIGFDTEQVKENIQAFVDNYNALKSEIDILTNYGESDLEEDGALAGDSLVRGIQTGLANILFSSVDSSDLGTIYQIGIEYTDDGELEISSTDNIGLGSGEDRLTDALDDNFDEIAALFTDEENGIAVRLYDFVEEYTNYSGLLKTREDTAKDQREQIYDDRETLELRLASTEQILRDKYLNLDQTVASLNSTSSALLATLG